MANIEILPEETPINQRIVIEQPFPCGNHIRLALSGMTGGGRAAGFSGIMHFIPAYLSYAQTEELIRDLQDALDMGRSMGLPAEPDTHAPEDRPESWG